MYKPQLLGATHGRHTELGASGARASNIQHAERLGLLQNGVVRHEARDPLPLWVTSIVTHDVKLRWV